MPPLNWEVFAKLPGSRQDNFELLCRAAMRRNFAQFGTFAARAAQPGVEFHLKLDRTCSLGEPDRWYGWQCRWWDLQSGLAIGTTRRNKIQAAIETTHTELPDLTDWVVWTRYPLTAGDQKWIYGLRTPMKLHLWTAVDLEGYLTGEAEILRSTYFGELVFTPAFLEAKQAELVAPIKKRWIPQVHQRVRAERVVRAALGETESWQNVDDVATALREACEALRAEQHIVAALQPAAEALIANAEVAVAHLVALRAGISAVDLDHLNEVLAKAPPKPNSDMLTLPRRLRATRHFAGLLATNLVARLRDVHALGATVRRSFSVGVVAVVADAGNGKTQMAAELTAATPERPAGVLLHGKDLLAGQSLDALANRVVVAGKPVPSMEALLAALDAAGQRAKRRLPLLIDGLNEAEDPRDWKPILAWLTTATNRFPYVLVVCTIRGAFVDEALPDGLTTLDIKGFAEDTASAIQRYFDYFKIDRADSDVPVELLSHPLMLRLFCETTNPTRTDIVPVASAPGSMSALFDRYITQAAERITEMSSVRQRYFQQNVRAALDKVGYAFWEQRTRGLDLDALLSLLGDQHRPWDQSLVRALENEGILLRFPKQSGSGQMAPVFDALGGHLIADAVLTRHGQAAAETWIAAAATKALLSGPYEERHPLASDIFTSVVALFPRRLHSRQVWQIVDEPMRSSALRLAADLEAEYVDGATVEQLASFLRLPSMGLSDLFTRLRQTRRLADHPLNSEFLDRVLRAWPVAERDQRWSEWLRESEVTLADISRFADRWRSNRHHPGDVLWARWLMWTLTSSMRAVRDESTRALYWFGRLDPTALFDLTAEALEVNDLYVSERMLACSYGVAMAHQISTPSFAAAFGTYLQALAAAFFGGNATHPTNHWLSRTYTRGTFEFARRHYSSVVPTHVRRGTLKFAAAAEVEPLPDGDERADEVRSTLRMDFTNYTIGYLFSGRRNYDMEHRGHKEAVEYIRGVVWDLGWREVPFVRIDEYISSSDRRPRAQRARTERYGKKYSWIGFYTFAGILENRSRKAITRTTLAEVDIDPSFPNPLQPDLAMDHKWLIPDASSDRAWIATAATTAPPDELFYREKIADQSGPWIAVHANIRTTDNVLDRTAFALLSAVAVDARYAEPLIDVLRKVRRPGDRLTQVPEDYYTFAGEIPWSDGFARQGADEEPLYHIASSIDSKRARIETLVHRYGWESHHSSANDAGGALVPSKLFSTHHDLRGVAQTFNQVLPNGALAAVCVAAPAGSDGQILFLRKDLLEQYLSGRQLVCFAWGERHLYGAEVPQWYADLVTEAKNVWRVIREPRELVAAPSPPLRSRTKRDTTERAAANPIVKQGLGKRARKNR